jgi:hypothetical protein
MAAADLPRHIVDERERRQKFGFVCHRGALRLECAYPETPLWTRIIHDPWLV